MPSKKIGLKTDFKKIDEWLGEEGKKILVYHRDADGVCSAALIMKFFPGFESIPREGPIIDRQFFGSVVSKRPRLLVFLDMPIDQEWKKVSKFFEALPDLRIIIIDHHLPEKNMNTSRIIHVNPMFEANVYQPASCVVFELLGKMKYDAKPFRWISLIGIIGDYGVKDCKWMFADYKKEGGSMDCGLPEMSDVISSSITLKGVRGAEKSLSLLVRSREYDEFKRSRELAGWNTIVQKEVRRIVEDFERKKTGEGKVVFYEIRSKMNITSIIATITAERYPDNIIIIRKKSGDQWKISLRYQAGSTSVGDLAKYASKDIGSGGGHVKSAGALVSDWDTFRKRVFEYLKKA